MNKRRGANFLLVTLVTLVVFLGVTLLAGFAQTLLPQQTAPDGEASNADMPFPEPTYPTDVPPRPTPPPFPTPGPLRRPPVPVSLPLTNPSAPNIAWGVETGNSLTIWVGLYADAPLPGITLARPIVAWNQALELIDVSVSPDRHSLAIITTMAPGVDHEGIPNDTLLWVIDLATNQVQGVPDYDRHYDLYAKHSGVRLTDILGWLDNERFAVDEMATFRPAIARKDGIAYTWPPFPSREVGAPEGALSPDGTTFFAQIISEEGGLWLYNTDGSNPRKVAERSEERVVYNPTWSPNGRYIAYLSPRMTFQDGQRQVHDNQGAIWVLDLQTNTHRVVAGEQTWDAVPAWSADSSKLAFLRADAPIAEDAFSSYDWPELIATNVFVADVANLQPRRLTSFSGQKHGSLEWTAGGNLQLTSTVLGTGGGLSLVALPSSGGAATLLVNPAPGELLVHPRLFK